MFNHAPLLLACLLLAGCGSDEPTAVPAPAPPGTGRAVLTPQAKVLDPAELQMLTSIVPQGELVELVFSSSSPTLSGVVAGDVLIAGVSGPTPAGGLFKVENATPRDTGLVISARTATLGDAFQELEIHLNTELTQPAETNAAFQTQSSDVAESQQALGVTFPFSLPAGEGPNRMELKGSLSLDPEPPTVNLFFDWANFELRDLNLEFGAKESFRAELTAQGRTSFDESITLPTIAFPPIVIPIPIPFPPVSFRWC